MAESKKFLTFGLEQKLVEIQLLKTLRYFLRGKVQDDSLLNCVKYFIYDYFYIIKGKNYTKFKNIQKGIIQIEPNVKYLVLVAGCPDGSTIGGFSLNISDKEETESINTGEKLDVQMGDVLEIESANKARCTSNSLLICWEVEESENSDDWLEIDRFIHLVSKPSWTNHFPSLS